MNSQNRPLPDAPQASKGKRWIDGAFSPATQAAEAHTCPSCREQLNELCGDVIVQQSWFRLAPEARLCSVHGDVASTGRIDTT